MKKLRIFISICLMIVMTSLSVNATSFPDTQDHWANHWIDLFSDKGYVQGYPDGLFRPDTPISREEAELILERYGAAALIELSNAGLTREEAIAAVAQAIERVGGTVPDVSDISLSFSDNETIDEWAVNYAKQLIKLGTLNGYPDNAVRGKINITRAEFVKLLYEPTPIPTPEPKVFSITYEPNGGHGERFIDENISGESYTIKNAEETSINKTNYILVGWNTVADGSGHQYTPGETLIITEDLTLYAQWMLNKSQPPTINKVMETDTVITGSGISGSQIVVTLPDGSTVSATVASDGTWLVNVPSNASLSVGNIVSANQTESGKAISDEVYTTVIGNPEIVPNINIFVENLTTGLDYGQAGDVLLCDVIVSNNESTSSMWPSAYVTFYLNGSATLQENSIRINNRAANSSQYSYDSAANTLTLYLGNIVGGNIVSISFRVTLNSNISDINDIVLDATLGSL